MAEGPNGDFKVIDPSRCGRAPYNFVRLPKDIAWLGNYSPPSQAAYDPDLRSGYIDLEMEALTDFYIRGTWPLKDYSSKRTSKQERPFEIGGKLRIPGSTLRGMIRGLVEILAYSPLDPINKSRFAYRTVGSSANPKSPDFEPCAPKYNEVMKTVQAGYLINEIDHKSGLEEWFIRPAKRMPGNNQQVYKFEESRTDLREPVHFSKPHPSRDTRQRAFVVDSCSSGVATAALPNKGWLVCSGPIEGRRYQWIINEPDNTKTPLRIPQADFDKHEEAELTGWIKEAKQDRLYNADGIPVFYVQATGPIKVYFGKTYYFRLPYSHTTHDFNRGAKREIDVVHVDLAKAMFGYAANLDSKNELRKGRSSQICFEDALELESRQLTPTEVVLGEPHPSIFQHYLEQDSESTTKARHWDLEDAKLRGFKIYWHRPGIGIREYTGDNKDVASKFLRVGSGARFAARIRYDNLNDVELGALLTGLELPSDCAHRLGMGKALGLGSFRITTRLVQISRDQRYEALFDSSGSKLERGIIESPTKHSRDYKLNFTEWLFDHLKLESATADIWSDPLCPRRLLDLRNLLTYNGAPMNLPEWEHATRYLEFGIVPGYNRKDGREQNYNEYQQVGWPSTPVKSRRRPLPRVADVIKFDKAIPKTRRPPFKNA